MNNREPLVEFFFSFRSPYSYLAAVRAFALPDRWAIRLVYRGVRPMVMRGRPVPRAKKLHILRDAAREARRLGIPFGNMYDPIGAGVLRCIKIAEFANDTGRVRPFVECASRAIWSEAADVASDAPLRSICERAGLDWTDCQRALRDENLLQRCEDNAQRLRACGHWGVPTFVFQREPFWGQDRIDDLQRAFEQAGIAQR